jgi:nucleoside-diphosphate kinase
MAGQQGLKKLRHMPASEGTSACPLPYAAVIRPALSLFLEIFMAVERTLSIIKPDATRRNLTGKIVAKFEDAGLSVVASRRIRLSNAQAEAFYGVHRERPFFRSLVDFMTSGPVVVQVLEGDNAIAKNREVMGATNPANAAAGTIRKEFAESIEANSVHGSDAAETAANEIRFFFSDLDIHS